MLSRMIVGHKRSKRGVGTEAGDKGKGTRDKEGQRYDTTYLRLMMISLVRRDALRI